VDAQAVSSIVFLQDYLLSFPGAIQFKTIALYKTEPEMKQIGAFFKTTLIGGIVVILPVAILIFVAKWLFNTISAIIEPITRLFATESSFQGFMVDIMVISIIIGICFFVGIFVRTKLGSWIYGILDRRILKIIPGYSMIKETVAQFIGDKKSPFSSVALAQIFCNDTLVSAFITDTHENGDYTIFVPTGPNPTSGNIYHVQAQYVHPVNVSVEEAMRSIISCGAGSTGLVTAYRALKK